jgi:hypothetical protein
MGLPFQGMALPADPQLPSDVRLIDLVHDYCSGPNSMSVLVVWIEVMDVLLHQCITTIIVRIYGSLGTQGISGGQFRIMQRVLDGDFSSWGLMLHANMMGQIHRFRTTIFSDFFFGSIFVAWFLETVPMLCSRVLLSAIVLQELRCNGLKFWYGMEGGVWPLFYDHISKCVVPYATNYSIVPIWWDGLLT